MDPHSRIRDNYNKLVEEKVGSKTERVKIRDILKTVKYLKSNKINRLLEKTNPEQKIKIHSNATNIILAIGKLKRVQKKGSLKRKVIKDLQIMNRKMGRLIDILKYHLPQAERHSEINETMANIRNAPAIEAKRNEVLSQVPEQDRTNEITELSTEVIKEAEQVDIEALVEQVTESYKNINQILSEKYEEVQREDAQALMEQAQKVTELAKQGSKQVAKTIQSYTPKRIPIPKDLLQKVLKSEPVLRDAVDNLLGFAHKHLIAENQGHRTISKLGPKQKKAILLLHGTRQKIKSTEQALEDIKVLSENPIFFFDCDRQIQNLETKLEELQRSKRTWETVLKGAKELLEKDRVGDLVPITQNNLVLAANRHFAGLSRAVIALQKKYPYFDSLPRQFQGLLIAEHLQVMQNDTIQQQSVSRGPITLPDLSDTQREGLLRMGELNHKITRMKERYAERDIIYVDLLPREAEPLQKLEQEMQKLRNEREIMAPEIRELDREIGEQMAQGDWEAELEQIKRISEVLVQRVLFPNGVKMGKVRKALLKRFKTSGEKVLITVFNNVIWSMVNTYGDPDQLNQLLEPALLSQLTSNVAARLDGLIANLEREKADYKKAIFHWGGRDFNAINQQLKELKDDRAKLKVPTLPPKESENSPKEEAFSDWQLAQIILGKTAEELSEEKLKMTEAYKDVAFNISRIGLPNTTKALEVVDGYIKQSSGWADLGRVFAEDKSRQVAMGFGDLELNKALGFGVEALTTEQTTPPPVVPSYEEKEAAQRRVRKQLQQTVSDTLKRYTDPHGPEKLSWYAWGVHAVQGLHDVGLTPDLDLIGLASSGAAQLFDITQHQILNRMFFYDVLGSLVDSIENAPILQSSYF